MGCGQECQARALVVLFAMGGAVVGALVSPLLDEKRGIGALVGAGVAGLGMGLIQMNKLKPSSEQIVKANPLIIADGDKMSCANRAYREANPEKCAQY